MKQIKIDTINIPNQIANVTRYRGKVKLGKQLIP
jgi:hypothetical protein